MGDSFGNDRYLADAAEFGHIWPLAIRSSAGGTRVVFPAPGGAIRTRLECAASSPVISGRTASTGSGVNLYYGFMRRRDFTTSMAGAAIAAPAAPSYRIIDSHTHVWKKDPCYPWAKETTNPPDKDATAGMLLDLMKKHGVARTVIIQVIYYRWDNSYLADVLKQYPNEFHGVARVNPEDPAAPDHLSRLIQEQRFRGVRLSPGGQCFRRLDSRPADAAAVEALSGTENADDAACADLANARCRGPH